MLAMAKVVAAAHVDCRPRAYPVSAKMYGLPRRAAIAVELLDCYYDAARAFFRASASNQPVRLGRRAHTLRMPDSELRRNTGATFCCSLRLH